MLKNRLQEAQKMRIKGNRLIAVILVLVLAFQFTGCTGGSGKLSGDPSEFMNNLKSSINDLDKDEILSLMLIDSGSGRYKEYDSCLDLSAYTTDAAKCYKAVASLIEIDFDDSDIEIGDGIAKVKIKITMPAWKKVFGDISFANADTVVSALSKIEKESSEMTLRIVNGKNGLKLKNADELLEIFEFVGADIYILSHQPEPTEPSKPTETEPTTPPTEPTEPTEPTTPPTEPTEPSETEPSNPSETEPSGSSAETKQGTKEDVAAAYAEYLKLVNANKDGIAWYEKTFNSNACGLIDINGDSIPELYFFCQSKYSDDYVNFYVYTYNAAKKKAVMSMFETLTQAGSDISEFFVMMTKDKKIVTYRGYVSKDSSILTYNIYAYKKSATTLSFDGNMFCTLTPSFKDGDGKEFNANVYTLTGVDKYTSNTSVDKAEFSRVEKSVLGGCQSLFSASFQKAQKSSAYNLLGSKKAVGSTSGSLIKTLGG